MTRRVIEYSCADHFVSNDTTSGFGDWPDPDRLIQGL